MFFKEIDKSSCHPWKKQIVLHILEKVQYHHYTTAVEKSSVQSVTVLGPLVNWMLRHLRFVVSIQPWHLLLGWDPGELDLVSTAVLFMSSPAEENCD